MGAGAHRFDAPRRTVGINVTDQPLTPAEGFILSQIDGRTTIADLELITGMPPEDLAQALERLHALSLIESGPVVLTRGDIHNAILPPPSVRPPPSERPPVSDRPPVSEQAPAGQAAPEPVMPSPPPPPEEGAASLPPDLPPHAAGTEDRAADYVADEKAREARKTLPPVVPPVPELPSVPFVPQAPKRLAPLSEEERRRIDQFLTRANSADFYGLLGLTRKATRAEVRTAYFALAKEFHTDAYYGRDISRAKAKLERIFRQITRAYEVLSRAQQRREYDQYLRSQSVLRGHEEEEQAWKEEERARSRPSLEEAAAAAAAMVPPGGPALSGAEEPGPEGSVTPPAGGAVSASTGDAAEAERARLSSPPPGIPLSSAAETGIEARPGVVPAAPAATGPRASDAWRRQRAAKQLAAMLGAGRARPAGPEERRGADYLANAEAAAKEEEWGRVYGLLEAAEKLGLTEAERVRHGELRTVAGQQLSRMSLSQAKFAESTGDMQAALRHAEQACRFGPEVADHWDMAARLGLRLGRELHKARDAAMKAILLAPKVVGYRVTMARVYLAAGLPKNARREADTALELAPEDRQAKSLMAEVRRASS